MKPLSMDLRERIIAVVEQGDSSIRKIAQRFSVNKSTVERLIKRQRIEGNVSPLQQGGYRISALIPHQEKLLTIVEQQPDATLAEYCGLLFEQTGLWVSTSTMCRTLIRLNRPRKKRHSVPVKPPVSVSNI